MMEFINRERELETLKKEHDSGKAELLVVYGRRRVGKTELLKCFFKDKTHLYFLADMQKEEKLLEIFSEIARRTQDRNYLEFRNWDVFFEFIKELAEDRIVVVFDEVGYINRANPAFYSILQRHWDEKLRETKVFMVLCGSSVSMMEKEVLGYGSPLYGRRTGQIELKPLRYKDARSFFLQLKEEEMIEFYSVLGGIPAYLNQFDGNRNVYWNIKKNITNPDKFLYKEPKFILLEELRDPTTYFSVLSSISKGARKFNEISQKSYVEPNKLSKYLQVLINLRLIEKIVPVTQKKESRRSTSYRIMDNFFDFWFRYINPNTSLIEEGDIETVMKYIKSDFSRFVSKVFEDICKEVIVECGKGKKSLPSFTKIGTWWDKGEEIDIVAFNEKTKEILFGECKWTEKKVKEDVIEQLTEKAHSVKWHNSKRTEHFVVFSKAGFANSAKKCAADYEVQLMDVRKFKDVYENKD